jgi:hypothetical protein
MKFLIGIIKLMLRTHCSSCTSVQYFSVTMADSLHILTVLNSLLTRLSLTVLYNKVVNLNDKEKDIGKKLPQI